ncbi:hypothetical protein [Polymorphospora sp. NPDC050346]|uniref:aromatic-ring hydroxylase C-terminal domain-containing protein n=1 Tax=Polymorphospora sp. NPDC050346 TaxID=3155780 RepID=UPI0033C96508
MRWPSTSRRPVSATDFPHVWQQDGDRRVSTLDLLGPRPTLLATPAGAAWADKAARSPPNDGCRCAHPVGPDVLGGPGNSSTSVFDVTAFGVVFVRPDGHVGWRSRHTPDIAPEVVLNRLPVR